MTKIDIYSGFLGAGKTTLIKKLIAEGYKGQKLVLIENEFGEIGIDGGFLQDAGINITEMNSGCICCSLVGDFGKALEKVISEYHPDRVIIEPSGVGKLSDVIGAVKKVVGHDVELGYTVAVADAGKVKVYMKNFGEFYNNQIETASTIVLSRTTGITEKKLDTALELIREHNGSATIVTTPWEDLAGEQLIAAFEGQHTLAKHMEATEHDHHHHHHEHDEHCCCGHDHEHHHHHEHGEECGCGHDHHEHHHHHDHGEESAAVIITTTRAATSIITAMCPMSAAMTIITMTTTSIAAAVTPMIMSITTMSMAKTAPAAAMTTIITTTPMRSSPPGAVRLQRSTPPSRSVPFWRSWIPASMASF